MAFYNSGSRGWVNGRMGEVAYLGTWNGDPGQDEPTVLGGNAEMGSPQTGWPRFNRVATQPSDYVGPGQVAWFQFTIQAPDRPGSYRLYIRPLVEGATWMEDAGVYWNVTVLNNDGTPPAGRVSSRVPAPIEATSPSWAPAQFENVAQAQPPDSGIALVGGTKGIWTSMWVRTRFPFSQLIPSWSADTPSGSWIEVEIQARTAAGRETRWWRMGIWAYGDETIRRTSVGGQSDTDGVVETDTFKTRAEKMTDYRARVTLSRTVPASASPTLRRFDAVVSDTRGYTPRYPSPRYTERAMELPVPRYSQEIHAGEFPEYDGGGEAWCSPTSTAMVLGALGASPSDDELEKFPGPNYGDPQVDFAARYTYDWNYKGAGNWPANVAYATHFGLEGFVTRLRSLSEAELFIAASIPLVASINGDLPGFLFGKTNGHLLVIRGFDSKGDVIT
ncbi:MAG TPA: C39 family peptidase, partial [Thermoanaerobaculia bacterium]|nr:C39 family peptidase [Thermoanaerobaculia bacterium]